MTLKCPFSPPFLSKYFNTFVTGRTKIVARRVVSSFHCGRNMGSLITPTLTNGHGHPVNGHAHQRGALIVFEGCDKAGKSTQCRMLVDALNKSGKPSCLINFPDRTTEIGKLIDQYLKCKKSLSDEAIHLLFSANRWEFAPIIDAALQKGETVIVDRYAFSGVAFSAAKGTLDLEWCKGPDIGLPQPDQVFYLNVTDEVASQRGDFGQERYEKREFQKKVKQIFFEIQDSSYWKVIDAARPIQDVHAELFNLTIDTIESSSHKPILGLWKSSSEFQTSKSIIA